MSQLRIRKDLDEGIVEVDTGDGWRGLAPDAARELADYYEKGVEVGEIRETPGVSMFINRLRTYAEDVEDV